jgi:hypothetical protein
MARPDDNDDLQDLEARETLAAEDVAEVETDEDDDLARSLEAHASEDIVGDVDGDDYRAGTLDPEGSDRGQRGALRLDDGKGPMR